MSQLPYFEITMNSKDNKLVYSHTPPFVTTAYKFAMLFNLLCITEQFGVTNIIHCLPFLETCQLQETQNIYLSGEVHFPVPGNVRAGGKNTLCCSLVRAEKPEQLHSHLARRKHIMSHRACCLHYPQGLLRVQKPFSFGQHTTSSHSLNGTRQVLAELSVYHCR